MPNDREIKEKTRAETYLIYFGMFITFVSTLVYPVINQYFPELTETDRQKELIHEEALKIALEFPSIVNKRIENDSIMFVEAVNSIRANIHLNKNRINDFDEELQALRKQINFNTYQVSVNSKAIYLTMRKPSSNCLAIPYRYANSKDDRYVLFQDWYNIETMQPIQIGSECCVYVTPFDRNRILYKCENE